MIIDAAAEHGEAIWRAGDAMLADAAVVRFADFVRSRGIRLDGGYDDLWHWSVEEPDRFWVLFAEFAGVELDGTPGPVRTEDPMPRTRWFPGRTVNFARHLLEGREGTALVAVAEDGTTTEIGWAA